ncbi:MAG: 23S rRNA (guanosine(2251)-2'-O)-methyltransferase RlmB [Desulfosalsimonadaceae bacterium]
MESSAYEDILYGLHPVLEAQRAGRRRFREILVAAKKPGKNIREVLRRAEAGRIPISRKAGGNLETITGTSAHQGIAARVSPYPATECAELFAARDGQDIFLFLDGIKDPQNLGALIRTALCTGTKGVIIAKNRQAAPTPAVSKTSAGALEHILLARVTNLVQAIKDLKKIGGWIIGLDAKAPQSIYETDFTGTAGIVVGGEEAGIRPLVRGECDFLAHIPMAACAVSSLNASAAGAVVLYEAFRQQRTAGVPQKH